MIQANEAVGSEAARWNAFIGASSRHSFLQTWAWGDMQRTIGARFWRVVVEDAGKLLAAALVIERQLQLGYSWLYIPRGPMFLEGLSEHDTKLVWDVLEEKLKSLADECGAFFVRIDPAWDSFSRAGWRKASREVQPRTTLLLDLTKSKEQLLAGLHPKTRYNIRTAERKGVQVRFSQSPEDVEQFLRVSQSVTFRSGFAYHPDSYYHAMMNVLGNAGMAELAIAEVGGEGIAAHVMIYADGIATYAHGASLYEKRSYMAPALLYWQTIVRAKEKGMQRYDFFGIAPQDADEHHPWAGITRMKLGFGGEKKEYCGSYDFVLNEGLYTGFVMMRGVARTIRNTIRGL
jgi:lipid II:glycine glycyltransferase (peptidoglycan interpeptide bridge formation enzyme)